MDIDQAVASQLRAERVSAKLTMDQVVSRTAISKSSLVRYEKGDRVIPISIVSVLAATYGVGVREIIGAAVTRIEGQGASAAEVPAETRAGAKEDAFEPHRPPPAQSPARARGEQGASPWASRVLAARRRAQLTQEDLAERAGVSVGTVKNIEGGFVKPQKAKLDAVKIVLGLDRDRMQVWTNEEWQIAEVVVALYARVPEDERAVAAGKVTALFAEMLMGGSAERGPASSNLRNQPRQCTEPGSADL